MERRPRPHSPPTNIILNTTIPVPPTIDDRNPESSKPIVVSQDVADPQSVHELPLRNHSPLPDLRTRQVLFHIAYPVTITHTIQTSNIADSTAITCHEHTFEGGEPTICSNSAVGREGGLELLRLSRMVGERSAMDACAEQSVGPVTSGLAGSKSQKPARLTPFDRDKAEKEKNKNKNMFLVQCDSTQQLDSGIHNQERRKVRSEGIDGLDYNKTNIERGNITYNLSTPDTENKNN